MRNCSSDEETETDNVQLHPAVRMMISNVILSMQETSLPAQQLSTKSDSQLSLDPVALDISLKPEAEMGHDYAPSKDMHDQSDSVRNVQTANPVKVETDMGDESGSVEDVETTEVYAQSDSVSNVQTANPVKVETDMGDESGSVEDVETTEVCAQSDGVSNVQTANPVKVETDMVMRVGVLRM